MPGCPLCDEGCDVCDPPPTFDCDHCEDEGCEECDPLNPQNMDSDDARNWGYHPRKRG